MLERWLAVSFLTASTSFAQDLHGDLQSVPYEILESYSTVFIDFENQSDWSSVPMALNKELAENGAVFATAFEGQSVRGQISDTFVVSPLSLNPISQFSKVDIEAAFSEPDGYRTIPNYVRRSIYLPLAIGGLGRRPANMLSGYSTSSGNQVLTSLSPRLLLHSDGSWSDSSVVGIEPVAVLFEKDQTAVGFTLVSLNRRSQQGQVRSSMNETLVQIKFFRRNGSLISEVIFENFGTVRLAFARCGGATDIAGIQITNSSQTGLAFDDFIFGVPVRESEPVTPLESSDLLTYPDEEIQQNPLQVDLCSYYTS